MNAIVIGGGASGMVAAIKLQENGIKTILIEKNEKLGKKIFITGKGRCNLTNYCDVQEFLKNVVHGSKFLKTAIYNFTPYDTISFFNSLGLETVVERGNRVFPTSQKSSDVIKALKTRLEQLHVNIVLNSEVKSVIKEKNSFIVKTENNEFVSDSVFIATGGLSYPSTGSTGDGYKIAKSFDISVKKCKPSLTQIIIKEPISDLEGISLKNVSLTALDQNNKEIISDFGEMLFTKNGMSGPIALTLSSYLNEYTNAKIILDLKPALDFKTLDNRLVREFAERSNQDLKNVSRALLIARLNNFVIKKANLDGNKKVNILTREERENFVETIKNLEFTFKGVGSFNEAVITSGGVDLLELKPSCETKKVEKLYFIGETIDVDALTGGFNLQIAYSTAIIASRDLIKKSEAYND